MSQSNIETVDIRPAEMSVDNSILFYHALDDVGKACFVDCLNSDDRKKFIDALKKQSINRGTRLEQNNI